MRSYAGTHEGREIRSLYPNLYRVHYAAYIGRRFYDVDEIIAATCEHHARSRAGSRHRDIRGAINVEQVGTLAPVKSGVRGGMVPGDYSRSPEAL